MLEFVIIAVVYGALMRNEKKSMTGSVALMTVVTLGIGVLGYFCTMHVLIEFADIDSMWVARLVILAWLGLGYGAYRLIQARRDKAFYDRLNE